MTSAELELPSGDRRPLPVRLVRAGARRGVLRLRLTRRSGVAVASVARATTLRVRTKAPSAPANLTAAAGDSTVSLNWGASSGGRLSGYYVYMSGARIATVGLRTSYTATGLSNGATYSFYVVAFDAAGNTSAASNTVTATPQATLSPSPPADTTPPSTPANVRATGGDAQVALSWSASSDNVGVTGYRVYRNGRVVGSPSGTSFTDTGLTDGTTYDYEVAATDAAGNVSAQSGMVSATAVAPPAPASGLGGSLPAGLPESSGPVVYGSASQSLGSLLSGLSAGSVLCLHSGTYGLGVTSQAVLSASGSASNPITVESCPGETAVIRQLIKVTGSYVRLRNLVIDRNAYPTDSRYGQGGSSPGGNVGIWLAGPHVTLEHSEIRNNTMSGVFGGGPYDQLLDNYIHNNGTTPDDHGVYWTSSDSLLANNLVIANYDMGVQLGYSSTTGNVIANNTSARNGLVDATHPGSGFVTFSGTASNLFVNNIAYANGQYGFKTYDTANALSHNASYANPAGDTYGSFASNSSLLHADPLFVSASDYGLQSSSPARGYGDSAYTPPTDYNANGRPAADLGALN